MKSIRTGNEISITNDHSSMFNIPSITQHTYIHGWTHVFINFHNLQLRSFPFISSYFLDFWFMLMSCEINVCITPLLRTERKSMLETMFVLDLKLNWTCFCMSLKPSFSSFLSVFDAWLNTVVCSPSISAWVYGMCCMGFIALFMDVFGFMRKTRENEGRELWLLTFFKLWPSD